MRDGTPRFSIISAAYDVSGYLPDFIASVEGQTHGLDDVEVIVVDDGSTDGTLAALEAWQRRRPDLVRVLAQANTGQAGARNAGLALARGEWLTFPDPDDALDPGYLASVARFIDEHPDLDLVATNRLLWEEADGTPPTNSHPLRHMFTRDALVDLAERPDYFQGSAPAAFFRRDRIEELGLRFDPRIRPNFEDGHFTASYLLASARPQVGFLRSAGYHYRRRADGSSTLQSRRADLSRHDDVIVHGYLDVIGQARSRYGEIPTWLANLLLHDVSGYFSLTDSDAPPGMPTTGAAADRFHELMGQVLGSLDLDRLVPGHTSPLLRMSRYVLQHGYRDEPWHEPVAAIEKFDEKQRLVRIIYMFTGEAPRETLRCDGQVVAPKHAKYRNLTFCGRTLMRQRVMWVPARQTVEVSLDDVPLDLVFTRPPVPRHRMNPGLMFWNLSPESPRPEAEAAAIAAPVPTTREGRRALRDRDKPRVRDRYAEAWVLMDRIHDAGDSGEILFRYLRANHPEINAWFVIEKGTADWERLRTEKYADRLVAHDSPEWRLLMAHCVHLVSSHADEAVIRPPAILEFTKPRWKNTFLQHGVIKDDLSNWLSRKPLDTFVTSSRQEYASIAGDDTPYLFTTKEVVNTGMPRFDRLLEVGRRFPPPTRDLVLVAPTWRQWLIQPISAGRQRRAIDDAALESDFMQQWLRLLNHPEVADACREHGLTLGFLPHPNLQPLLPRLELGPHVQPLTYDGNDVQEFFARARVLVTDFSSVAFNAAYLERPTVYFQFDEDQVLTGAHVGKAGYFDYRRDGFGPVETTADNAAKAIRDALEHGPDPLPTYQARIEATFPERDGRCCERVVEAIRNSARPQGLAVPVPTPEQPR